MTSLALLTSSKFLSTPSARRATLRLGHIQVPAEISIHALREEGDDGLVLVDLLEPAISIHALREEGDARRFLAGSQCPYFYPRPPRGGRPQLRQPACLPAWISIHALREEGDDRILGRNHLLADFYPRPPRGGRPYPSRTTTPSFSISIHALREEGDFHGSRSRRT